MPTSVRRAASPAERRRKAQRDRMNSPQNRETLGNRPAPKPRYIQQYDHKTKTWKRVRATTSSTRYQGDARRRRKPNPLNRSRSR